MLWRTSFLKAVCACLLLCSCLAVYGCGYTVGAGAPDVVSGASDAEPRKLAFGEFENPTLETWLDSALRSKIRDELGMRGLAEWTSPGKADLKLSIKIIRFTVSAAIKNRLEETLKSQVELRIEARLDRVEDSTPIWESGPIKSIETYYNEVDRPAAEQTAVTLAVRELANRMGHSY